MVLRWSLERLHFLSFITLGLNVWWVLGLFVPWFNIFRRLIHNLQLHWRRNNGKGRMMIFLQLHWTFIISYNSCNLSNGILFFIRRGCRRGRIRRNFVWSDFNVGSHNCWVRNHCFTFNHTFDFNGSVDTYLLKSIKKSLRGQIKRSMNRSWYFRS